MIRKGAVIIVVFMLMIQVVLSGCSPKGGGSGNPEESSNVLERT